MTSTLMEKAERQEPVTAGDAKVAVREKGQEVRTQASDRLRQEVDQRATEAGEQLQTFAQTMRRTASELRAQGQHGQSALFDQLAMRAEQLAGYLTQADADEFLEQAKTSGARALRTVRGGAGGVGQRLTRAASQAKQNPIVLGAGAIAAGLLLARRMQGGFGGRQQTQAEALEPLTKKELQQRAASAGVEVKRSMTKQDLIEALQAQASTARRSKAKANPVAVQKFLEAVRYPAGKAALLSEAERRGADPQIRTTLERLPRKRFRGPTEVSEAIGKLE